MDDVRPTVDPAAWSELEELGRRHWAEVAGQDGADGALRAAEAQRRWIRAVRPDWPTPTERDADLAVHTRVSRALRAVD